MKPDLVSKWRCWPEFTSLIKSHGDCVLRRIAAQNDLLCYPSDYYSLDAILYTQNDVVPHSPTDSTWVRGLSVAFEHENDIRSGIYKEVSHLLLVEADLKVLVAYPDGGIEGPEWQHAHQIIAGSRNPSAISRDQSFLVILGWENGFEWRGYIFHESGWVELTRHES